MAREKKLDLVGVAEVKEMLGVSRQRVHQLIHDHPDFPAEVADLAAGKIWYRSDVQKWAEKRSARQGPAKSRRSAKGPQGG